MRKLLFRTALPALIILVSCKGNIHREFRTFDNYTWNRFDKVTYTFTVDNQGTQVRYCAVAEVTSSSCLTTNCPSISSSPLLPAKSASWKKPIIVKDKDNNLQGEGAGSLLGHPGGDLPYFLLQ